MGVTPILLVLFAGGVLIAAAYRITPQQAWASLRGRVEAIEELYRRPARRSAILRALPDFLGNLLLGYQVQGHLLEALSFAVRLAPADDPIGAALSGALRRSRLAQDKYPALHQAARELDAPLLIDLFRLLQEAEQEGGDIKAILESYLEHAYQLKSTRLLEQAKVLPLQLLGITVPLLLPVMIIVMVAPFLYQVVQVWGK